MRISDWSSDVCSSDLLRRAAEYLVHEAVLRAPQAHRVEAGGGQEIGGIVAAAVRRGKDQRQGLPLRLDDLVRLWGLGARRDRVHRSEEHTSELQSLMRNSYAVFCLKKKKKKKNNT